MALNPQLVERISAAMYGYAGASAGATTLTPFRAPTQNTNPAGTGTQAAAVTSAGTGTQSALSQLLAQVPSTLQSLASGGASQAMPNMLSNPLVTSRRSAPRVASQHDEEAKCRNHQRHPRRHPM
jgi:PPE-repeat protein